MPVELQSDTISITFNLAASRFTRFGGKTSYRLMHRGHGVEYHESIAALFGVFREHMAPGEIAVSHQLQKMLLA